MSSFTDSLEQLVQLTYAAQEVTKALVNMREELTEEQWESLIDNPAVDLLVSSCMDLEYIVENNS
jgi:hypothetical protein